MRFLSPVWATGALLLLAFAAAGTRADEAAAAPAGEKFEFQAEVNRLMNIIINSLYTNRDIFVRELVSNAADALEKIRFLRVASEPLKTEDVELDIRIIPDANAQTLTIVDHGVGMTKEDLIANLGTIARSGTTKFVEAASKGGDNAMGLIGQFGVGFYSAFLVADKVTFTTKHVNDTQWVWVSDASTGFEVYKDPAGETLGPHGSSITLHLKDDAKEFAQDSKLRDLVHKHSDFVQYPIYLQVTKEVETEVPVEEAQPVEKDEEGTEKKESEDLDITEEDTEAEKKPTTKKVKESVKEWEQVNSGKPLWARPIDQITKEEYVNFYKAFAKDDKEPLIHSHFKAEGSVEFTGLLYIPSVAPYDLYDKYYTDANRAIKVYVRRVLLTESIDKEALPQYLNFVKGVVDSEDLPINVNRESLQKDNGVLKTIGKRVTKKVLSMLEELAEMPAEEEKKDDDEKKDGDAEKKDGDAEKKTAQTPYEKFWSQFSRSIKLGVLEDKKNKGKLEKLLRFKSLNHPDKVISLDDYVSAMPEGQKDIYYISGPDQATVEKSPMLEQLKARKFDCLFFVDNIDEYLAGALTEFDGKKLQSVTKEGLDLGEMTQEEKELHEDVEEAFKETLKFMKDTLKDRKVSKVEISKRLSGTPAVLVSTRWGWTANMERIMRGQAMGDFEKQRFMIGGRTLEVNPAHPIIKEIKRRVDRDETDDLEYICHLVLDAALINSGFTHEDVQDFVGRLNRVLETNLGVVGQPVEMPVVPKKERKAPEDAAADKEAFADDDDDDDDKEEL